jgi:two-component system, NtrC family, response regulator AtoC
MIESMRVLIVDDDPIVSLWMRRTLTAAGLSVQAAVDARSCLELLPADFRGVVILDIELPDRDGVELFGDVKAVAPDAPVVFLTSHGTADLALDAVREGAFAFLDKACAPEVLVRTIQSAFRQVSAEADAKLEGRFLGFEGVVARSRSMRAAVRTLQNAIDIRVPVLIRGEQGTGRERLALALHKRSLRSSGPFEVVRCGALPDAEVEAEVFGRQGANAQDYAAGALDRAAGGTLLLVEIGDVNPTVQARLLRVLKEGVWAPVGGGALRRADMRLVATTSRDLEDEVAAGHFREDLYYRLHGFAVDVPPLRDRAEDLGQLAAELLASNPLSESPKSGFDALSMELLRSYSFPGNVQELANIIAYAATAARSDVIHTADLPPSLLHAVAMERSRGGRHDLAAAATESDDSGAFLTLEALELRHIVKALQRADGNKALAARLLGISRMTLYRKIKELGL